MTWPSASELQLGVVHAEDVPESVGEGTWGRSTALKPPLHGLKRTARRQPGPSMEKLYQT